HPELGDEAGAPFTDWRPLGLNPDGGADLRTLSGHTCETSCCCPMSLAPRAHRALSHLRQAETLFATAKAKAFQGVVPECRAAPAYVCARRQTRWKVGQARA